MKSRLLAMMLAGVMALGGGWIEAAQTQAKKPGKALRVPKPDAVIPLWPGNPPGWLPGGKAENYVNERYANVSVPQLLVYRPKTDGEKKTALIVCPGGGYTCLAMRGDVYNVAERLNQRGIVFFTLKYRTKYGANDVMADALADVKRAVRIVRSRAREWGIDPQRIGVQGYSAGGNLCLNLAGHFDAGNPGAADPIERMSSRPDFVALMCPWPNKRTIKDFPLGKDTPPTFIAHARDDRTAPFAFGEAIDGKLKGLGVKEKMFVVETGGHMAFTYGVGQGPGQQWEGPLLGWMKEIGMR